MAVPMRPRDALIWGLGGMARSPGQTMECSVARRLRLQFPGAIYHVINRGNYRRDLFATVGAAQAFERALGEATLRFDWRIHAFCLLHNHFHLAVTTPIPNLDDGMHWLQTVFAVRFNRFRSECGHLFQGRYQSPLVEDGAALTRVVNYIHLNPVRAGLVPPEYVAQFRWSSLARYVKGPRAAWLSPQAWLKEIDLEDSAHGWAGYVAKLVGLARDPHAQREQGFDEFSHTWAIGTSGWKRALAHRYGHRALELDLPSCEIRALKEERWRAVLGEELRRHAKESVDPASEAKGAVWKLEIALVLRKRSGAPYAWIADALAMGSPNAVRVAVCRLANM